jgi:hypothetical protein
MPVMDLVESKELCNICKGNDRRCIVCGGKGYHIVWRNNEGKICFKT